MTEPDLLVMDHAAGESATVQALWMDGELISVERISLTFVLPPASPDWLRRHPPIKQNPRRKSRD